jgi:anaerobic selenocysteine-containing dehydrogenase
MTKSKVPQIGRREFLAVCGLTGASASLPCLAQNLQAAAPFGGCKTFNATCSMECLHCNLKGYVDKDGRLVKIESDNAFDGKACSRGLSRVKWVYAKDRILHPLKRVGKKGEGKFEAISWDEALDLVASKMKEAIEKDGSSSLLFTSASGNMDNLHNGVQVALGNYLGGVTRTAGSLCCSAVAAAMNPIVGLRYADTRDTIPDAKLIIAWGNNPLVTQQAYWPRYLKMLENGGKLIVIDPRKSETAARATEWIPIVPGTDAALELGLIRVLAHEKLINKALLLEHTGAPYLVGKDGKLVRIPQDGKDTYAVWDEKTKSVKPHDAAGVKPAFPPRKSRNSRVFTPRAPR